MRNRPTGTRDLRARGRGLTTATPTGPACGSSWPGSASAGSPPPRRCAAAARASPSSTARRRGASASGRTILRCSASPSVSAPARHRCRTAPSSSSPRPGWRPDAPAARRGGRGRHPDLGRGRAGLAPARRPAPPLAGGHRHQRQDHHGPHAGLHPARRRAARDRRRQHRHAAPRGRAPPEPYDVLAVELSSFQLHWQRSVPPLAAAVLNLAPDHLDWHGSLEAYAAAKGRIYPGTQVACVYNVADPGTERLVEEADVAEGCRAIGFTLGRPRRRARRRRRHAGRPGLRRAAAALRGRAGRRSPTCRRRAAGRAAQRRQRPRRGRAGPRVRRAGRWPSATGCARSRPTRTASPRSPRVDGVRYVDDSKATNPHAAAASLAAYEHVVWIAGGLLKGADVDDLVRAAADRLRGVVLHRRRPGPDRRGPGATRARCPGGRRRPTPTLGRWTASSPRRPRWRAPGDTVLLAPAGASMDMFADYGARGDAFAEAVRATRVGPEGPRHVSTTASTTRPASATAARGAGLAARCPPAALESPGDHLLPAARHAAILVVIGLVMVLSASMVDVAAADAARRTGSSSASCASRSSASVGAVVAARIAGPGLEAARDTRCSAGRSCSRLVFTPLGRLGQRQPQLDRRRAGMQVQPSELVKLGSSWSARPSWPGSGASSTSSSHVVVPLSRPRRRRRARGSCSWATTWEPP